MTAATIKETTTLSNRLLLLYEACLELGLVALSLLPSCGKILVLHLGKLENIFKSKEAVFRARAVIL